MPVVSVLIPTFKPNLEYLREALNSVFAQTFQDFEILVMDDSPSVERVGVVETCKQLGDSRVRVVQSNERLGISASLNEGIRQAKGVFIARMDADDICLPERFARQLDYLEKNPEVAVCGTQFEVFGSRQAVTDHPVTPQGVRDDLLFRGCVLGHPTVMVRKAVLQKLGLYYDPAAHCAEDYRLWAALSQHTFLSNTPEVLLRYRHHEQQATRTQAIHTDRATGEIKVDLLLHLIPPAERQTSDSALLKDLIVSRLAIRTPMLKELASLFNRLYEQNKNLNFYTGQRLRTYLQDQWQSQFEGDLLDSWGRLFAYYQCRLVFFLSRLMLRRHLGLFRRILKRK